MTAAQNNRQEAIYMLTALYIPESETGIRFPHFGGWGSNIIGIVNNIDKLRSLGRTARWDATLTRWQIMINQAHDSQYLRWAILQGSVYANYAAM